MSLRSLRGALHSEHYPCHFGDNGSTLHGSSFSILRCEASKNRKTCNLSDDRYRPRCYDWMLFVKGKHSVDLVSASIKGEALACLERAASGGA